MATEEEQVIKSIVSGDRELFRFIVDRYKNYIFAIILRFVHEPSEAENIAQEVFIHIYKALPSYRHEGFRTWIGKIAMTSAIDWHRAKKRRPPDTLVSNMEDSKMSYATSEGPEEIYLRKERREKILAICQSLPEAYRNAVHKFYFEGKSQGEIAEEEGTTVKTIESRLYRAKHLLRERWGEADESRKIQ